MKHSEEFLALTKAAQANVREISIEEVDELLAKGASLIDVREDSEWQAGHAKGAKHMGRGIIERDIVQTFPDKNTEIILYCGGGYRSILTAESIQKMGYTNVKSMIGGWRGWVDAKKPVES
jgi:rhodanese-related sulfurtransferase